MNPLVTLLISLAFLVLSANILVKSAEALSYLVKFSPLVIGATVIAIGTSLPETSVAINSIIQKAPSLSLGDVIGSNIINFCFVLGLSVIFFPIRMGTEKTQRNNVLLFLLTLFFTGLFFVPYFLRRLIVFLLPIFYLVFLTLEIKWSESGSQHEDKKTIAKLEKPKLPLWLLIMGLLTSLLVLIFSSKFLVNSAILVARLLKFDKEVIGLTIIALGTSLPELITSIVAASQKDYKLLYGDIQGSNIYNLSILGTLLLIFSVDSFDKANNLSLIFLLLSSLTTFLLTNFYTGKPIPKKFGVFYIGIYFLYLYLVLV